MHLNDFLNLYLKDGFINAVASAIKPNEPQHFQLKGIIGSLDAVLAAAFYRLNRQSHLFILHDKEEAAYFFNDLQNLVKDKTVLFFPASYKKPYQYEETENANVLLRAEVLNRINHKSIEGELIVSYPEALTEKVINKQSLLSNTFSTSVGEEIDIDFISELLTTFDFERTDFVYEAGQYAVRGGIVDIFSYANELPYRLEFFGNQIESIRTFHPDSQLSLDEIEQINIIPNVQTKLLEEKRQSFLEFLPKNTKIWFKDYQQTLDVIDLGFQKSQEKFTSVLEEGGNTQVVLKPKELFENSQAFKDDLGAFALIEFGKRFYLENSTIFSFEVEPQPSFNKNFELLVENLNQNQNQGILNIVVAESEKQLERLSTIFEELDPFLDFRNLSIDLREGFIDKILKLACFTDHQIFERFHRYKVKESYSKAKAITLKELNSLQPGDYVTHIDYGIGKFAGLDKVEVGGKEQEMLRLIYRDDDLLYVSIHSLHKIAKYTGKEGQIPAISKLGTQEWEIKKKRIKKNVQDIAKDLINLYAKRKAAPGMAFSQDSFMQAELESSFIYEDTPDQARSTADVKTDMEAAHPMDRLVCGDVGFGKTEIAIRAAFKANADNKQVAVLVPTTILALQHYHTFKERLSGFPVKVAYINRFKSSKEVKQTVKELEEGQVDILIGTHRLVNKDVKFKDLGLLIIDEEQKFGVKVKEKIKEIKVNVDVLTLTATPIPRTLHFSLMGARDLSIIATPPPNRQPVTTEIQVFKNEMIRDAVSFELRRGGQVFFIHNRISDIEQIANLILKLVPDARIGIAHGQLEGKKLEKVMVNFIEGNYDVLVSTNIVESGLDIPNANTIIINNAHMFGLSDLHQMRGRVGRSNKKAFCYLLSPPTVGLTSEARKRLNTLEEFSELGDGFKVAMRDLDIRGAGNLLGAEQSGFITDLGFDMYHKILDEAVQELKETEFKDLFEKELGETSQALVKDCNLETDLEILIPEEYVSSISERIRLYSTLDNVKNENELSEFISAVTDRFGPYPESVNELIKSVRLRWKAENLGIDRLMLKNDTMKCYFPVSTNEAYYKSATFGKVLQFVQSHSRNCKMKEFKKRLVLTIENINTVDQAIHMLEAMH
ncbi:MAG: transcription-repair coupling factor [Candidatus Cyclobacteriaceae bacterium M3_2C_046]